MNAYEFTSKTGKTISIKANDGVHVSVDGRSIGYCNLIKHAVHGDAMETIMGQRITIPVAAEHMDAVKAVFSEADARVAANTAFHREMDAHRNGVLKMLNK